jgi:magnesium transporter
MSRKRRKRGTRNQPGTSPGTLLVDPEAPRPAIHITGYGPEECVERDIASPAELRPLLGRWPVLWVNVDGLGDAGVLGEIGRLFAIHPLALEDVVAVHQRPKVDAYDTHLFVVMRMIEDSGSEQLSIFVGNGYVLTFQERRGDCFEPVRQRIRGGKGRIRVSGADYLAYALIDAVIDAYFPLLESLANRLEEAEALIFPTHDDAAVAQILEIKSQLRELRRHTWPHREVVGSLLRDGTPFISAETRLYLRDYLSSASNRMSEVMKTLTVITVIFIPLSFIASVYGMNFDSSASRWNMPELGWAWGYPTVLLVMAVVACGLLLWFRRRGWLGSRGLPRS